MEEKYANIIIDISHEKLDRTFQYLIPEELLGKIQVGMLVRIPFGKGNRLIQGYVLEVTDEAEFEHEKMKYLQEIITDNSLVESKMIQLAWWMKHQYGSTMITSLKTVLPMKRQVKPKQRKYAKLKLSVKESFEKLNYYESKGQVARTRLLGELMKDEIVALEVLRSKLNISLATIKAMEEQGVLTIEAEQIYRNPIRLIYNKDSRFALNEEQKYIAESILNDFESGKRETYLIHGVTGSGKTEVYMELIEELIKKQKQIIVLIPEIALTYQTVMRFYKKFGDRVSTLHSRLSEGEKYDQFERAKRGELDIMIGPRSALFTPFQNLGLIIIDEEHEAAYKSETMPKYHARETAEALAKLHDAAVILGSATPSVESYYRAQKGEYRLFKLLKRAKTEEMPTVYTVDLREELRKGNRSVFSDQLKELIKDRLRKKQQIMLFLNRRGYAGFVSCRSCGHVMKCPHCDVALSSHKNGKLMCHYCGYEQPNVQTCPECDSKYIGGMRAGTEQIETLIKKAYPAARVLRMDMDTTKSKEGHEKILTAFANREADILVGTQMIVKGHDFPYVTLVGVLAADMSLNANDYRAAERTFQLLTQAAGRAGRDKLKGEVVIQTYNPEHYSIVAAGQQDYSAFYENEIAYRSLLGYPPTADMLVVLIEGLDEDQTKAVSKEAAEWVKDCIKNHKDTIIQIIGPTDASIGKINDIYRRILYLKSNEYKMLTGIKDLLETYLEEKDYKNIRVQFDFNPMNTY